MSNIPPTRDVTDSSAGPVAYSFCTLVTRLSEYREMVSAFADVGFTDADCEFLYVDNSVANRLDAFEAYNRFLLDARGRYVVLCHQDILPRGKDRAHLDTVLTALTALDPAWGLCGNAGMTAAGRSAVCLSHPDRDFEEGGPFPVKVMSIDENFIVVRREANLALSRDLAGFHWYGSDLCMIADTLGWSAYVVDFRVLHKSSGNIKGDFRERAVRFRQKYANAFRPRWQYVVTSQPVYVSSSRLQTLLQRIRNGVTWRVAGLWSQWRHRSGPVRHTSERPE